MKCLILYPGWQFGQFSPLVWLGGNGKSQLGKLWQGLSKDVTEPNSCQRSARGEKVTQAPSKMKTLMSLLSKPWKIKCLEKYQCLKDLIYLLQVEFIIHHIFTSLTIEETQLYLYIAVAKWKEGPDENNIWKCMLSFSWHAIHIERNLCQRKGGTEHMFSMEDRMMENCQTRMFSCKTGKISPDHGQT